MATRRVRLIEAKLRAAISYIVVRSEHANLSTVKLHKVLYYTDMLHFIQTGQPVTGAQYRKRPFGPICDALLRVLEEMAQDGEIRIDTVDYFGYQKKQLTVLRESETNRLSPGELDLLDESIRFVCDNNTAQTISDFSHDMVWDMVEYGEIMPYYNAILLLPNQVSEDTFAWADAEISKIEALQDKTTNGTVDHTKFRTLRQSLKELRKR